MADGARSDNPAVQAQLDRLNALSPGRDILGLERIRQLLDRLGNPHCDLPPVFHVAGTNGKGSTCAFLRAMLEADSKRVHVYSSPHLVRFNERIRLAGRLITDQALAPLLAEAIAAAEGTGASFFEVTTAAAFLAFARSSADACIIEVGLGGRLDATNVIPAPAACGIAALGIDHERFLLAEEVGTPADPMTRIAWEKAGIAKADVPLVTLDYTPAMNEIIAAHAATVGAKLFRQDSDWSFAPIAQGMNYRDAAGSLALPNPALPGDFQLTNAALAVAMLRHQNAVPVADQAIAAGISGATWPARLQRLANGPLTHGREIWLDGGHNRNAGEAVAAHFNDLPDKSLHLVIGMLANKAPDAIIGPLAAKLASLTIVPVPEHDSHGAEQFGPHAANASDVQDALAELHPDNGETILIGGSLYLAGEVLRMNGQIPD